MVNEQLFHLRVVKSKLDGFLAETFYNHEIKHTKTTQKTIENNLVSLGSISFHLRRKVPIKVNGFAY